jgi:hypothetical protein
VHKFQDVAFSRFSSQEDFEQETEALLAKTQTPELIVAAISARRSRIGHRSPDTRLPRAVFCLQTAVCPGDGAD